jgi:hypothetical protein
MWCDEGYEALLDDGSIYTGAVLIFQVNLSSPGNVMAVTRSRLTRGEEAEIMNPGPNEENPSHSHPRLAPHQH